ncbi:hypothetical protein tinsulaeT_27130 [Thalassotalea insulae]|uniref:Uncharacterized protein n=1 Tax=Thalassotalea insulae TaxID=2056778 RepID=A0ABQ6GTW3_9GAMM|nr:hypothetical protein tinsulaeT_27130 [Thalassotalea insulae]
MKMRRYNWKIATVYIVSATASLVVLQYLINL